MVVRGDTGDVQEQQWQAQVEEAVLREDAAALRALFTEAERLFGPEASTRWAQALSAFDAHAVTG